MNETYSENLGDFKALLKNKNLYLFGAGNTCVNFLNEFSFKDKVKVIFDNNPDKVGTFICGVEVASSKLIKTLNGSDSVFLITTYYANAIKEQLEKMGMIYIIHFYSLGFNKQDLILHPMINEQNLEKLELIKNMLMDEKSKEVLDKIIFLRQTSNPIYGYGYDYHPFFGKDILQFSEEEVFVDGGAFNGDTVEFFKLISKNKYKKIYAFEPDEKNFFSLQQKYKDDDSIICIQAGLWEDKKELCFINSNDVAARIDEAGESIIKVEKIDGFVEETVTFIKMDIEGAELKALMGAKESILMGKPKLAISIYHNSSDLWEIPLWLKKIMPEYSFYIRHYSYACDDTVLYAVIK